MATKKELLLQGISRSVGAGRGLDFETVDFSDPNRPKTCLEVDFPILPVNQIAQIEGNAGKPIYQMSKWWARRRSSVFRSLLLSAAIKAPEDKSQAAKTALDAYYANHQKKQSFSRLKVADIFMGGGTTLVEGSRLGMQMAGTDLNPIAWFVVKQEFAQIDRREVERLLADIEAEVRPQIAPFFYCDGPNGEKGTWTHIPSNRIMGSEFDPFKLTPSERLEYRYEGPEIIYGFWGKHGPCQVTGCGHRTPIVSSPVAAIKTLTVRAWEQTCKSCGCVYDVEEAAARMAPDVPLVVAPDEKPYTVLGGRGQVSCPRCRTSSLAPSGKGKNKKVELSLLLHPHWLSGAPRVGGQQETFGGTPQDTATDTAAWNSARAASARLIEVRGPLPSSITCPETGESIKTGKDGGTVPKKAHFACAKCGTIQNSLTTVRATGKAAPAALYAIHGYSRRREAAGVPYSGRFFAPASEAVARQYDAAAREWEQRKDGDLAAYWPRSELPYGFMTHTLQGGVPNHGYTHWWTMFNSRQLLVLALLLKAICTTGDYKEEVRDFVLGAFQQYLRNQNMFCFWDRDYDKLVPHFSNNNYHPKNTPVENSVFANLGRGNWTSCVEGILEALDWMQAPWEQVSKAGLVKYDQALAEKISGKSEKVRTGDAVGSADIRQASATSLGHIRTGEIDLVITDPPFGGLIHYSELADFFYVWLRLALKDRYPSEFGPEYTPKTLGSGPIKLLA